MVWKVERSCRSESKPYAGRGNGKYRKQQGGKHFDASKCEGWEKEEEEGEASPRRHRRQLVPARPLSLPSRSFPPAISRPILQRLQRVRCALRALMMPMSLSTLCVHCALYSFTVPLWARHQDSQGYSSILSMLKRDGSKTNVGCHNCEVLTF